MMLLPFWTDGCIDSMEGLFFESSATTPYHFLASRRSRPHRHDPVRNLRYDPLDVEKGTKYMQILGVKYYMAFSPAAVKEARQQNRTSLSRDLRAVGDLPGRRHRHRHAAHEPARRRRRAPTKTRSHGCTCPRTCSIDPTQWDVEPGRSGPKDWQRVETGPTTACRRQRCRTPVQVVEHHRRERRPDQLRRRQGRRARAREGVVLPELAGVRARRGRTGWRPNLMVVIPTSNARLAALRPHDRSTSSRCSSRCSASPALCGSLAAGRSSSRRRPQPEEPLDPHERSRRSSGTPGRSGTAPMVGARHATRGGVALRAAVGSRARGRFIRAETRPGRRRDGAVACVGHARSS